MLSGSNNTDFLPVCPCQSKLPPGLTKHPRSCRSVPGPRTASNERAPPDCPSPSEALPSFRSEKRKPPRLNSAMLPPYRPACLSVNGPRSNLLLSLNATEYFCQMAWLGFSYHLMPHRDLKCGPLRGWQ